ncbi:integrase core domain-containing protein [Hirsutella rhossiliensis]|uniref:Integrase core domain-containing protein n=1 Tax=Hirsutella rhossiliensis TaxID=111463 RepID=A0A9P8SGD0_9HYPO|nr:integrase core domain-containing protein [Hirsutella rhossiliensis]KAH0959871.1 integrase core domain-containing protein [Hirsutella rhossiliensis]
MQDDLDEAAFKATKARRRTSRDPRPVATADSDLWHARLGHPGPQALEMLGQRKGIRIKGPRTVECEPCAQGRAYRQVSRRTPNKDRSHPCEEIWIDWTDLSPDYKGFVRVMFITDAYSGMIFPYFLRTYQNKHNWGALRDFVSWMKLRFDYSVKTIRSDGELFTKATKKWLRKKGISAEPSSPNTQSQNGGAERSGGALMERAAR